MLGSKLTNHIALGLFQLHGFDRTDPMSSPPNALLFADNDMTRPLSPTLTKSNGASELAHLALHPTIQDGLLSFHDASLNAGISPS